MSVLDPEFISADKSEAPLLRKLESILGNGALALPTVNTAPLKLVQPNGETTELPLSVLRALKQMIDYMVHEKALLMTPYKQAMSVQEAAHFLDVPRISVEELLEAGKLSVIPAGPCQLIPLEDLLEQRKLLKQERSKAFAEMAQIGSDSMEH